MKNSINQFVRSCGLRTWGRRGGRKKKGEKVYVPSLDHFVPFNCCKCTVINPGNFFVSFTAIKCVCQPPILIFFYRPKRLDYEQSPIFPQGWQSKRNASARQKSLHARRRDAVSLFSRGVIVTRACVLLALLSRGEMGDYLQSRNDL